MSLASKQPRARLRRGCCVGTPLYQNRLDSHYKYPARNAVTLAPRRAQHTPSLGRRYAVEA